MSQKSSVPQAISFVSQVLKRDTRHHYAHKVRGVSSNIFRQFTSLRFRAPPPLDAPSAPQQKILQGELALSLDKWSTTISARDLAFVCARSGLDLDHLIKGIAVRAFEGTKRRRSSRHDTSPKSGSDSIKIKIGARKPACNLTPMSQRLPAGNSA